MVYKGVVIINRHGDNSVVSLTSPWKAELVYILITKGVSSAKDYIEIYQTIRQETYIQKHKQISRRVSKQYTDVKFGFYYSPP